MSLTRLGSALGLAGWVGITCLVFAGLACGAGDLSGEDPPLGGSGGKVDDPWSGATGNVSEDLEEVWRYMRAEAPSDLQPGCEPARYSPPDGVAYRGVAIMLHGFSACPQQYEQLGPQMARAGYEVFVPLLVGHGRIPKRLDPRVDDVDFVPTAAGGWGPTVSRVIEIAKLSRGERIIIGLSHGADLGLRAVQWEPQLFDKVVAVSPKLRNETSQFLSLLTDPVHVLGIDEFILDMRSGWKQCEEVDSKPPANRAGFCYMQNRHAVAMLQFGGMTVEGADRLAKRGTTTRTALQLILAQSDNGACNDAASEVLDDMQAARSVAKACIMPEGVPHSMFSLHDTPYVKPWVPTLFNAIERFVVEGTPVPGSSDDVTPCALTW